jgi:hypothetical protein
MSATELVSLSDLLSGDPASRLIPRRCCQAVARELTKLTIASQRRAISSSPAAARPIAPKTAAFGTFAGRGMNHEVLRPVPHSARTALA